MMVGDKDEDKSGEPGPVAGEEAVAEEEEETKEYSEDEESFLDKDATSFETACDECEECESISGGNDPELERAWVGDCKKGCGGSC